MRKGICNAKKRRLRYKVVATRKTQVRILGEDEKTKEMFYEQYNIYGSYIAQEEIDIDKAIRSLDNIIKKKQVMC